MTAVDHASTTGWPVHIDEPASPQLHTHGTMALCLHVRPPDPVSDEPTPPKRRQDAAEFPPEAVSGSRPRRREVVPSGVLRVELGAEVVHKTERGELRVRLAAPRVLVLRYTGFADESFAVFADAVFDMSLEGKDGIELFIDCEEQTGYDTAFRERIARWAKDIDPRTRGVCVLVRSRIVAFGIAVTSILAGSRTTTVRTREAFASRLDAAVREGLEDDVSPKSFGKMRAPRAR